MPRPRKEFTPEEVEQITHAWEKHGTVSGVQRDLRVAWDTARRWLDRLGLRKDRTHREERLQARRGDTSYPWGIPQRRAGEVWEVLWTCPECKERNLDDVYTEDLPMCRGCGTEYDGWEELNVPMPT